MKEAHKKLLDHYLSGEHAFLACDDKDEMVGILQAVKSHLLDKTCLTLDCAGLSTPYEFSTELTQRTNAILDQYDEKLIGKTQRPGVCVQVLNDLLASHNAQGYLIISNVDDVISNQNTFEVEASLREVMQFRSDLAVLIAATRATIMTMSKGDRPFYLSFRKFWLGGSVTR